MNQAELNKLVAKAITGDRDALNDLFTATYQDMYHYARTVVNDPDLAADALQDSCEEIVKTIGTLRESAAYITWCRRIVYRRCIKQRGNSDEVPLDENEDGETILDRLPDESPCSLPEKVAENHELRQLLQEMLHSLSEEQRSALLLYHYEHFSIQQIARIQGENENTIKSRLRQGRIAMKKQAEVYEKKTGIKLRSVGLLPLMYYLFHAGRAESDAASASLLPRLQATVAAGSGAATGAAAAGTSFFSTLAFKVGAAVVAAVLVVGGAAIGILSGDEPVPTLPDSGYSEPSAPSQPVPPPSSNHPFQHYAFDADAHWLICDCPDAVDTRYAHTFADGECSVCRMPEPLPGGNPYLTYDTTRLGGHWLYLPVHTEDTAVADFYIGGDGSLTLQGKTYYPVGSRALDAPVDEPTPLLLCFREKPFDPKVGITEQEAYETPITLELKSADRVGVINLAIFGEGDDYYSGNFYRESDYFGYEKVALTQENYRDYLTVTPEPIGCSYSYGTFYSYSGIQFTLKEGVGEASCVRIRGSIVTEHHLVESNLQTQVSKFLTSFAEQKNTDLKMNFYGADCRKHIDIMHGKTIPINSVVKWYGDVPVDVVLDSVAGYVFVPKADSAR